jgi:DUF438 domain-containing protein
MRSIVFKNAGGAMDRKEILKDILKRIHSGENPEKIKEEFRELLESVSEEEIVKVEEELIQEGVSREEIHKLCEVHLQLFKEGLESKEHIAPEGHPVFILMEEHRLLLKFSKELKETLEKLKGFKDLKSAKEPIEVIEHIISHLKDSEKHYLREENVLFPILEKHGVTQPPAIMWMEHDRIREIKKGLYSTFDRREKISFEEFVENLSKGSVELFDMLSSHFYKENNILFPLSMRIFSDEEWNEVMVGFDDVGYCCFTPQKRWSAEVKKEPERKETGRIEFETGSLSPEEIEGIFKALPIDISFVDKDDIVRFYSESPQGRIFVRTKAVIGRKVQQCHPQKSLHIVNRILEEFKNGKRDVAEFWIDYRGKLVHIRYFPVRDKNGNYLGCIEVTQDITKIKKIEGEKRLLDEPE